MTPSQAYALAILDQTPEENHKYIIDYLCNGLDALGTPSHETETLRGFLLLQTQGKHLTSPTK